MSGATARAERITRMQTERHDRAQLQSGEMLFVRLDNAPDEWICVHEVATSRHRTETHTYQVSLRECDCPDYAIRCLPAGIPCKHILALEKLLGGPGAAPSTPVPDDDYDAFADGHFAPAPKFRTFANPLGHCESTKVPRDEKPLPRLDPAEYARIRAMADREF